MGSRCELDLMDGVDGMDGDFRQWVAPDSCPLSPEIRLAILSWIVTLQVEMDHLICALTRQLERIADAYECDLRLRREQANAVTRCDLKEMERRIIAAFRGVKESDITPLTEGLKDSTEALQAAVADAKMAAAGGQSGT